MKLILIEHIEVLNFIESISFNSSNNQVGIYDYNPHSLVCGGKHVVGEC